MRALTIVYMILACTVAGYAQTTATYDNVRARQQLTLNGHTLTSVLQTIDSLSTHAQGVTAKAVYDYVATKYGTITAGTGIDVTGTAPNYTISLDTLKRLHFRTDSTYSGGVGTMRWNLTDGTLDLGLLGGNVTLQLGQESVQRVKHADNSGLTEGKVVYIVGSSGDNMTVRYARANAESTSANTFGVMTENATGGDKAFCTTFGLVRNINTSNLTEGGMVWLSKDTAGAMTAVRPTAPNHGVEIGFCVRKHATTGIVFVTIQNGYELRELHDVYAPSPTNNQGLLWKSANSRWEAAEVDTSLNNEGRLIGFKPSNNSYYLINSSTTGSSGITLIRGTGIGFSGNGGSPEGGDLTINNTGDLDIGNEGILGVEAGAANTSVISSNSPGATGVTVSGSTGIAVTETTSSNGGTITITNSSPDQTVSIINGGGITPSGTYPNFTLTATDQSITNEIQRLDTFSLSGQTLRASLLNDNVPASTVTLPIIDVVAGTNVTVSKANGIATVSATGSGTVTGTGVAGRAAFWRSTSAISSDANFAWDSSNVRLNINNPGTPVAKLNIRGEGATSSTTSLSIRDSGNSQYLSAADNGTISLGKSFTISSAATYRVFSGTPTITNTVVGGLSQDVGFFQGGATYSGSEPFFAARAMQFSANNRNTSTNNQVWGAYFVAQNETTGSRASFLRGVDILMLNNSTGGTIADVQGLRISLQTHAVGSTITNTVGLLIDDLTPTTAGAQTNVFSIQSTDALARMTHAGSASFGTTTSSARLHVQGSNNTSGTYSFIATNSDGSTTTPAICAQNNQKVGIGTNSVDAGATLEVDGTTGGILFPRLTTTERDALTAVNGLMIYNTTTNKFQGYAGGAWVDLH